MAWFAVDRFPDTFPTQFVHREGVRVEEACSILTQDTTTTWWSEETITATTDKRRVVDRYVSTITVTDRYGAPVAGTEVTLSAESRTEVEVGAAGSRWSLATRHPGTATTDVLGRVTVRQAPTGLTLPGIHVDVPGVCNGAVLDPGAAVRTFLAGAAPSAQPHRWVHAEALLNAKVHGAWLVPGWHDPALAATLPTAGEVVTWCRQVLSPASPGAAAGWSLDLRPRRRHGDATANDSSAHHRRRPGRPPGRRARAAVVRRRAPHPGRLHPRPLGRDRRRRPPGHRGHAGRGRPDRDGVLVVAHRRSPVGLRGHPLVAEDAGAAHYVEATFQWIGAGVDG